MCTKFIFKNIVDYVIELSFRIFLSSIFDLPFKNLLSVNIFNTNRTRFFPLFEKKGKKKKVRRIDYREEKLSIGGKDKCRC